MEDDKGVHLRQVYPEKGDSDTDIDIIAIHGFDTKSPETWIWKHPGNPEMQVNWLQDPNMLPSTAKRVRIFTCDWPASLFQRSTTVQKTVEELSMLLFEGIQRGLQPMCGYGKEDRPIVFIASCLGGIILIKALVDTGETYISIRRATRGILFLATPFRGTSFQEVAAWAEPGLRIWARIRDRQVSKLIDSVKGSTFDLETLVRKFTNLSREKETSWILSNFYELGKTSLRPNGLPQTFSKKKLLVDRSSANLDIIPDPFPLDRPHVLMNKFSDPECPDYKVVAGRIQEMLKLIRRGGRADVWIRENSYTEDKLKIERLSGEKLEMELCYINLAIVEQIYGGNNRAVPRFSSFSLFTRLRIETPNEGIRVELPTIFDYRKGQNGNNFQPRRILIRGRAGVGKTTLCKKIVHDFIQGTWNDLFDRILWIPLRRLKAWKPQRYSLEELFYYEYFSQCEDGELLAKELSGVVRRRNGETTLFVLDGLDEVISGLSTDGNLPQLLNTLFNQPNVIITSRPHANLPSSVIPPELELETIGFYPGQVQDYTAKTCDFQKASEIKSYIQHHPLIEGLVRIPIQLDALCFTWNDDINHDHTPQTLTGIYQAIEHRLWKKDVLRLGKKYNQEPLTPDQIQTSSMRSIESLVENELLFLEYLAFTGLHNDIIDFEPKHLNKVSDEFSRRLLLDRFLPHLSFLRTSDPTARQSQNYHFLHLTFQEYYAARYFVRQWCSQTEFEGFECLDLKCLESQENGTTYCSTKRYNTTNYIRRHKYNTRYNVFWRFAAGLVQARGGDIQINRFFRAIEDEPRDLFGPAHQRLVMHCLSEVTPSQEMPRFNQLRTQLEGQLEKWLLFECHHGRYFNVLPLVGDREFPESVLEATIRKSPKDVRGRTLVMLGNRRPMPMKIGDYVGSCLDDEFDELIEAALEFFARHPESLSEDVCRRIFDLVTHPSPDIRHSVVKALHQQPKLPDSFVERTIVLLKHPDEGIRGSAVDILGQQTNLPENIIQGMVDLLKHTNNSLRLAAARALCQQSALPESVIDNIVERNDVRRAVVFASTAEPLPEELIETIAALLGNPDGDVRSHALLLFTQNETPLPEKVIHDIIALTEDPDSEVRSKVMDYLWRHMTKPEVSQAVLSLLMDPCWQVRSMALLTIEVDWTFVPDTAQAGIMAILLQDEEYSVVNTGIRIGLEHQLALPEIWQTVLAWMENPDLRGPNRRLMAQTLAEHSASLPKEICQRFMTWLYDTDEDAWYHLDISELWRQPTLPDSTLQSISTLLTDSALHPYRMRDFLHFFSVWTDNLSTSYTANGWAKVF
ncbi:hypothetical protein F5Y10DRAFT_292310 [Nemania abortiva]|nr:hypothetical protein F5Y10DRAFT_292310 [Nemania abortiva]